jgi:hypothetical protein
VKVLVTEAIRNTVSWVTGELVAISASPWPAKSSGRRSWTTPSAWPSAGQRFGIPPTLAFSSSAPIPVTAMVILTVLEAWVTPGPRLQVQ